VATNVTTGRVTPLKLWDKTKHLQTYRATGGAAPTNGVYTEAIPIPDTGIRISSSAGIDVYVAVSAASTAGSVRVDLP
jgi:hypothetical protein